MDEETIKRALIIYQGIEEKLRGIQGIKSIILGEPGEDFELPGIYSAFLRFEYTNAAQVKGLTYFWAHRLVIQWIGNDNAEMQLITLMDRIIYELGRDPTLGNRVTRGMSTVSSGDAGFATINKVKYRVLDIVTSTLDKSR